MMDWLKFRRLSSLLFFISCFSLVFVDCRPKEPQVFKNQNVGPAFGTSYSLIYISTRELDYQNEIDSVIVAVNQSMSTYMPNSDISKINNGNTEIVVDQMFQEVFQLSKEVYEKTSGYFDPTVGTLVNAWGFGPGKQITLDSARVDSLMQYVGFDKVALTPDNRIEKEHANIQFDFNAIAKGYAIDRLATLLNQKGIDNYLLEVGGELVAKGENIHGQRSWGVQIQDPQAAGAKLAIRLKNKAMASSGNYRKFRIDSITSKKYVHTINPKTGFTENGATLGANVLANTCAKADAYATAFMSMDLDTVKELLKNQPELDAYIIYLDQNGTTQEFMTPGFEKLVLD